MNFLSITYQLPSKPNMASTWLKRQRVLRNWIETWPTLTTEMQVLGHQHRVIVQFLRVGIFPRRYIVNLGAHFKAVIGTVLNKPHLLLWFANKYLHWTQWAWVNHLPRMLTLIQTSAEVGLQLLNSSWISKATNLYPLPIATSWSSQRSSLPTLLTSTWLMHSASLTLWVTTPSMQLRSLKASIKLWAVM